MIDATDSQHGTAPARWSFKATCAPPELWVVLAVCTGYLGFLHERGRFLEYDEIAYKSPGLHWAQSGRFAAPELMGFWRVVDPAGTLRSSEEAPPELETVWFINGVLYPFAFGVYTKLFGFGWRGCVWFDGLIRVVLSLLTYAAARRMAPSQSRWPAALAACAVIALGTEGRPDELAICFGMAGAWLLLAPSTGAATAAVSGLCLGLTAATSPTAASLMGFLGLGLLLTATTTWVRRLRLVFVWGSAALVPVLLVIVVMREVHPFAWRQYLAITHWNWQAAGLADARVSGVALLRIETLAGHRGGIVVAIVGRLEPGASRPRQGPGLWAGASAAVLFQLCVMPTKFFYYWFVGPWLLAALAVSLDRLRSVMSRRSCLALAAFVLFCMGLAALFPAKAALTLATLPPDQRIAPNESVLHQLVPRGSCVVDAMYWWSMADEGRNLDPYFARPDSSQVDFIVLGSNGSGELGRPVDSPAIPPEDLRARFHVIHDNLNRTPLALFGIPLSKSGYGFGFVVYERNRRVSQPR